MCHCMVDLLVIWPRIEERGYLYFRGREIVDQVNVSVYDLSTLVYYSSHSFSVRSMTFNLRELNEKWPQRFCLYIEHANICALMDWFKKVFYIICCFI